MTSDYYVGRDKCERCGADVKLSWAVLCESCAEVRETHVPRGGSDPA